MNLNDTLQRLLLASRQRSEQLHRWLAKQPQAILCAKHNAQRALDERASATALARGENKPAYKPCPACEAESAAERQALRLRRQGVPEELARASLDNFEATTDQQTKVVAMARQFVKLKAGFFFLLGDVGTGKSHIAAGILREAGAGLWISNDRLMATLSAEYRTHPTTSILEECERASLLVFDDLGISRGGQDEVPAIHRILTHRFNERLPTVVTSNKTQRDLPGYVGDRMWDRISESIYAICVLVGGSYRPRKRDQYLTAKA